MEISPNYKLHLLSKYKIEELDNLFGLRPVNCCCFKKSQFAFADVGKTTSYSPPPIFFRCVTSLTIYVQWKTSQLEFEAISHSYQQRLKRPFAEERFGKKQRRQQRRKNTEITPQWKKMMANKETPISLRARNLAAAWWRCKFFSPTLLNSAFDNDLRFSFTGPPARSRHDEIANPIFALFFANVRSFSLARTSFDLLSPLARCHY